MTCVVIGQKGAKLPPKLTMLLSLLIFVIGCTAIIDPVQKSALVDFYQATTRTLPWNITSNPCEDRWIGIVCEQVTAEA